MVFLKNFKRNNLCRFVLRCNEETYIRINSCIWYSVAYPFKKVENSVHVIIYSALQSSIVLHKWKIKIFITLHDISYVKCMKHQMFHWIAVVKDVWHLLQQRFSETSVSHSVSRLFIAVFETSILIIIYIQYAH